MNGFIKFLIDFKLAFLNLLKSALIFSTRDVSRVVSQCVDVVSSRSPTYNRSKASISSDEMIFLTRYNLSFPSVQIRHDTFFGFWDVQLIIQN